MKVNSITRLVVGCILVIFCRAAARTCGSSLSDERGARPGKSALRDLFTNTRTRSRAPDTRITPGEHYLPESSRLPDVSVTCCRSYFVLRVKTRFFGFSAAAEELALGESCRSNGVTADGDWLFTYALTDCQGVRQVFPDCVIYTHVLRYEPLSRRNPLLRHVAHVHVGVECRYEREPHVIGPTITPTQMTLLRKVIRSRSADFQIQLMDDSWSAPVSSAVFLLGQSVNVQISTRHLYPGLKLFVNSCHVASTTTLRQAPKYSIIDNYGCLRESRINPGASRFRSSKADNVVQFSFKAFQFTDAPDAQVSLHCELSVSDGGPSSMQKSCFYRHPDKRWISVFGQDSVCDCCNSVCNQTKTKPFYEGFISSDQALFSDMSPSNLKSPRTAHRNDDPIWFEARQVNEPQRSYTHMDFVASVTLLSSEEDHAERPHESHNSTVDLLEEEENGDVEILMAVSKSFVESERPDLVSVEQFEIESLGRSRERKMQDVNKRLSVWPKKIQRVGVSMNTSGIMADEVGVQRSTMNDSVPADGKLPSFVSEEKEGRNSSENTNKDLDFLLITLLEETSKFPGGSDDLDEQGLVRTLEDLEDYYFLEEV